MTGLMVATVLRPSLMLDANSGLSFVKVPCNELGLCFFGRLRPLPHVDALDTSYGKAAAGISGAAWWGPGCTALSG